MTRILDFLVSLSQKRKEIDQQELDRIKKQENKHYVGLVLYIKRKHNIPATMAVRIVDRSLQRNKVA